MLEVLDETAEMVQRTKTHLADPLLLGTRSSRASFISTPISEHTNLPLLPRPASSRVFSLHIDIDTRSFSSTLLDDISPRLPLAESLRCLKDSH